MPVLRPEDLRWLVCPVCRQSLAPDEDSVRCSGCNRRYPILDGIPILLAARAI
jgi:uncharacterized protein YbaR (Trm112 family)